MAHYSDDVDPFMADIHAAILADDPRQLAQVCQEDVDLDERFSPSVNDMHAGMTPLALACALNKPKLAEVLLNNGADVDATFAQLNTTALMTSAFHGHTDIVRLLLNKGADVARLDMQQSTALGYAFGGTRDLEVISLLLNAGVNVNQKNVLGMSALLLVAGYGNDKLVEMVLRAGADPNATNDFGHTALHLAVVGKKDQMQSVRSGDTSNTLNRRNLDIAMQEWARLHSDKVKGGPGQEDALAKVGQFMMSIGSKLEAPLSAEEDEQEAMKRRVEAVWKHRQEKLDESKQKKKSSVVSTLLSCGGGKSKKVNKSSAPRAQPYVPPDSGSQPSGEMAAINERCSHVLTLLIQAGCEIDRTESAFGMTALDMAILNGDVESSAQLVSAGGDPDHLMKMFALSDLYEALVTKNKKELKELLTYDEDLDVNMALSRFSITNKALSGPEAEETGDEGMMPIAIAAKTDDQEIVTMLLKHGADVNAMGPAGRSAIHEGAGKGSAKMCNFLLQKGANQELPATGFLDATPVCIAAIMRHHRVVELFITHGARVDRRLSDNTNSLIKAAASNDMEMVHILLQANLQRNFIDPQGFMFNMASKYQSSERDANSILQEVHRELGRLEEIEMEKARQAEREEEERRRVLPPPGKPNKQRVALPQPDRPAPQRPQAEERQPPLEAPPTHRQAPPTHRQAPPTTQESSSEEEREEAEGAPVIEQSPPRTFTTPPHANQSIETPIDSPLTMEQPPVAYRPAPQQPVAHVVGETNLDDEEEEESSEEESEEEEEEEESEEEEEEVNQQPVVQAAPVVTQAQPPMSPQGPPPPLPDAPPPPPPSGPPPDSEDDEEEEEEEEESSEEEEESEEEESEEEESEEEEEVNQQSRQVVTRTMTTEQQGGKTITVTKTTVSTVSQGVTLAGQEDEDDDEEEETEEEEETSEEEETDSDEEEESEEEEETTNQNARNNNITKPLNISHDNKETTI